MRNVFAQKQSHLFSRKRSLPTLGALTVAVALGSLSLQAQAQERWTMTSTWPDNLDLIQIDRHRAELVDKLKNEAKVI